MVDSKAKGESKSPTKASSTPPPSADAPPPTPLPTLDAAAFRLVSLLGLDNSNQSSSKALPSGAGRTVRRWLSAAAVNKCRKVRLFEEQRGVFPTPPSILLCATSPLPLVSTHSLTL